MNIEAKLSKARAALVMDQPFFGALVLRLPLREDASADTAWTDGKVIGYNPDFVGGLSMPELKGLLAHEVMHLALGHHTRRGKRDPKKWNVAADYAINGILLEAGFEVPAGGLFSNQYDNMSAEQIYAALPDGQDWEQAGGDFGEVRDAPHETPGELKVAEQTWKVAVTQAAKLAGSKGVIAGLGLDRAVQEALAPKVDWRTELREFLEVASRNDYSWLHPNPRYVGQGVFVPGLRSVELGRVVVAVDTSGSVTQDMLSQFAGEISRILEEFDTALTVVYADREVQGHEEFSRDDLPLTLDAKGGGGTDYRPVFDWIRKRDAPSCLVYLTDLCCRRYPVSEPEYPVLWVDVTGMYKGPDPPFGVVIQMECATGPRE